MSVEGNACDCPLTKKSFSFDSNYPKNKKLMVLVT